MDSLYILNSNKDQTIVIFLNETRVRLELKEILMFSWNLHIVDLKHDI